nr:MAG TPA: hypothetical protein [Caudoviricetes sp.]
MFFTRFWSILCKKPPICKWISGYLSVRICDYRCPISSLDIQVPWIGCLSRVQPVRSSTPSSLHRSSS